MYVDFLYSINDLSNAQILKLFLKYFIYLFLFQRAEGREKERNISVWLAVSCPLLRTWPATQECALDWELYQRPFDSQASTPPLSNTARAILKLLNFCQKGSEHSEHINQLQIKYEINELEKKMKDKEILKNKLMNKINFRS